MTANAFKQTVTWRAIFAALVLLFSSLAPTHSLAASEPEFCEMACCVADGHCCCAARKPWVKGQKADERPVVERIEIRSQSGCPCTLLPSSNFIPRAIARPAAHALDIARHPVFASHIASRLHHSIWFTPAPPRAPPSLLVNSQA